MNRRGFIRGLIAAAVVVPNAVLTSAAKAKAAFRPVVFGRCLNVEPLLIDSYYLVYVAASPLRAIEAVRDGGMKLIIDGDDPDRATLLIAAILPGHARTCVAEGLVRLGCWPVFPLTIDADGDGLRPRVTRMDELAGAVQDREYSGDWLDALDAQGLIVHTWGAHG